MESSKGIVMIRLQATVGQTTRARLFCLTRGTQMTLKVNNLEPLFPNIFFLTRLFLCFSFVTHSNFYRLYGPILYR